MATQSPFSFLNGLMERVMAGPQPPQWLVSEVHQRLVLFLNHVLMQEKEAMERLVRQKGRVARVQWRGYSMALQITPAGLFNVAPEGAQPDLLLEVTETRSEEHTSELQSQSNLVCRLLLEKKKKTTHVTQTKAT